MYAFHNVHWVQGSCCAKIESPRDTELSPGLCSSVSYEHRQQLDKKSHPPARRLGRDSLIPRLSLSGGRESLGTRARTTGRSSLRRLHINTQTSFFLVEGIIRVYLVKFWHNSECIKSLPRLQEPPDWLTAQAQHYLIRNFIYWYH